MNAHPHFVSSIARLVADGKSLPPGAIPPHHQPKPQADAPGALIFSSHPDDECIIGGFALRLMSVALLINQAVLTTIATFFLPTVGRHGYSRMFFVFAGCTVVYFITAAFFMSESKEKNLEEIEGYFEGGKRT